MIYMKIPKKVKEVKNNTIKNYYNLIDLAITIFSITFLK